MAELRFEMHDGDPGRVALILPGSGYTARGPLLAFAAGALIDLGWTVRTGVWEGRPELDEARSAYSRAVRGLVLETPGAKHLVVGKSLGTLALPAVVLEEVPGAWLTPLISDQAPEVHDVRDAALALATSGLPALLAGGSEDPQWDPVVAAKTGARVSEIHHANHDLTVPGDWRASHAALAEITTAIEELAVQVAG